MFADRLMFGTSHLRALFPSRSAPVVKNDLVSLRDDSTQLIMHDGAGMACSLNARAALNAGWDVIIAGGGSAGTALAARLSESPARRVLLLEAGLDWHPHEASPELRSPNATAILYPLHFQEIWQFPGLMSRRTAVQAPRLYWRGRGLGGSQGLRMKFVSRDWA